MSKVCLPCRFSTILLYRGLIFNALQQPARGQRDLRAAQEMGATGEKKYTENVDAKKTHHSEEKHVYLVGCFKYFLFSPLLGEMIQFD